ncbi:hypothetical protein YB2330_003020 [Saitoella coloradoensis]
MDKFRPARAASERSSLSSLHSLGEDSARESLTESLTESIPSFNSSIETPSLTDGGASSSAASFTSSEIVSDNSPKSIKHFNKEHRSNSSQSSDESYRPSTSAGSEHLTRSDHLKLPEVDVDDEEILQPTEDKEYAQPPPKQRTAADDMLAARQKMSIPRKAWWYTWATFKVFFPLGIVVALFVGYGFKIKFWHLGPFALGLYGAILIVDFLVQTSCAIMNRIWIWKIERAAIAKEKAMFEDGATDRGYEIAPVVVGYREAAEDWKACLRTLRDMDCPEVKVVIGVSDGDQGPDQEMAHGFKEVWIDELTEDQRKERPCGIFQLPEHLATVHTRHFNEYLESKNYQAITSTWVRFQNWIVGHHPPMEDEARSYAWVETTKEVKKIFNELELHKYKAVFFTQPHGSKRTAMFTGFMMAMQGYETKDYLFTTDSDTLVDKMALTHMARIMESDPMNGGVCGDVRISNKTGSVLAFMSHLRYWFAFNIERGCQSFFKCVTCISGPLGFYRVDHLKLVLGEWVTQSFGGKETTFGDDRHLTNCILNAGYNCRFTHLSVCDTETPTGFVRWVKQQTRWCKSFWREAFLFPRIFILHSMWGLIELSKQSLYPFVIISNVLQLLWDPLSGTWRPVAWFATIFAVALIKSFIAVCLTGKARVLWVSPSTASSVLFLRSLAIQVVRHIGDTWSERFFHVGHIIFWFAVLCAGLAKFLTVRMGGAIFAIAACAVLIPTSFLYYDVVIAYTRVYIINRLRSKPVTADVPISEPVEATTEIPADPASIELQEVKIFDISRTQSIADSGVGSSIHTGAGAGEEIKMVFEPAEQDPDLIEEIILEEPEQAEIGGSSLASPRPAVTRVSSTHTAHSARTQDSGYDTASLDPLSPSATDLSRGSSISDDNYFSAKPNSLSIKPHLLSSRRRSSMFSSGGGRRESAMLPSLLKTRSESVDSIASVSTIDSLMPPTPTTGNFQGFDARRKSSVMQLGRRESTLKHEISLKTPSYNQPHKMPTYLSNALASPTSETSKEGSKAAEPVLPAHLQALRNQQNQITFTY